MKDMTEAEMQAIAFLVGHHIDGHPAETTDLTTAHGILAEGQPWEALGKLVFLASCKANVRRLNERKAKALRQLHDRRGEAH